MTSSRVHAGLRIAGLLFVLAAATYGAGLDNPLILDDEYMVRDNAALRDLRQLPAFFVSTPPQKINRGYYRPLMLTSFALSGPSPRAHHAVNIALHALAGLLVWALLEQILGQRVPSVLGAALFVVHPVQTEVVYLVTYRATCLSALFFFAALLVYLSRPGGPPSFARCTAIASLYFASLASKEAGITLPLLMWLADRSLPPRRAFALGPYLACALVLALYLTLRAVLCEPSGIAYFHDQGPVAVFCAMVVVEAYSLLLALLPWRIVGTYDASALPVPWSFGQPVFWLAACVLVACVWLSWRARQREPSISFGLLFFFLTQFPSWNIIPIPNLFGERFLYLPLFGLCLVAAQRLGRVTSPRPLLATRVLAVCVCLAFAARSHVRAHDFRDERSYWQATVKTLPLSLQAHIGLAAAERRAQRCADALPHYEFSLQHADPRSPQARPIYGEAASCYSFTGQSERSLATIEAWLRVHPDDSGFQHMRSQLSAAARGR